MKAAIYARVSDGRHQDASKKFTCAVCGIVSERRVSDSDLIMEYQETFSGEERCRDAETPGLVCEACYQLAMRALESLREA